MKKFSKFIKSNLIRIGEVLKKFRSGKLPRSFQVIPLMENWESLLKITNPNDWTPHAFFEAVKIFTSQSESNRTVKFFSNYLLPRILNDIQRDKTLNYHLFRFFDKSNVQGYISSCFFFQRVHFSFYGNQRNNFKTG